MCENLWDPKRVLKLQKKIAKKEKDNCYLDSNNFDAVFNEYFDRYKNGNLKFNAAIKAVTSITKLPKQIVSYKLMILKEYGKK